MNRVSACLLPAVILLGLSACSTSGTYPSLERRDVERITGSAEPVAPQPEAIPALPPPSAELATRIAQLVEQARASHVRFGERRAQASRLIAAGGNAPVASESWSVASVALSDLEAARSQTMIALAELDALYAGESVKAADSGNPGDATAVAQAWRQVTALAAEEDEVLAGLRAKLRG
jgi:hypothetical protein